MESVEINENIFPSITDFYINIPIYNSFHLNEDNVKALLELHDYKGHIDCYCIYCKQPSVFHTNNQRFHVDGVGRYQTDFTKENNYIIAHKFSCTRNALHQLFFYFLIENQTITKIGQYPSLADLSVDDTSKYRQILGEALYFEFNRAVGLAAHGVGIGAFVYLRRIFESLIEEFHQKAVVTAGWNEVQYQKNRMDEKIKLLEAYIPDFLIQNKRLYSIMSEGIHELSEKGCLSSFPVIKLGIELILDDKYQKILRDRKINNATKAINTLNLKKQHKGVHSS